MSKIKLFRESHLPREHSCNLHVFKINIKYVDGDPPRRSDIIAAHLRTLAVYTDGFCADDGAEDEKITSTGLVLRFTSEEKREEFKKRVRLYTEIVIRNRLRIS